MAAKAEVVDRVKVVDKGEDRVVRDVAAKVDLSPGVRGGTACAPNAGKKNPMIGVFRVCKRSAPSAEQR